MDLDVETFPSTQTETFQGRETTTARSFRTPYVITGVKCVPEVINTEDLAAQKWSVYGISTFLFMILFIYFVLLFI